MEMTQNRVHTTSSGILIVEFDESHFFSTFFSPGFGLYIVILSGISTKTKNLRPSTTKIICGRGQSLRSPAMPVSKTLRIAFNYDADSDTPSPNGLVHAWHKIC